MKNMKQWLVIMGICTTLAGCQKVEEIKIEEHDTVEIELEKSEITAAETMVAETTVEVPEKRWTDEEIRETISFLEDNFGYGLEFHDMDQEKAEFYGAEILEYYDFAGRVTDDQVGYILGFLKGEENPFDGHYQYWQDGTFVIAEEIEDEKGNVEEKILYTLKDVDMISQGEDHEVIMLFLKDIEMPEELYIAFQNQYSNGEEGRTYLQDVLERGVRFSAPNSGAYMEVYRHENGTRRREYIPLTAEEEARILRSDALILPEWYGQYGLTVFLSEEKFEETGEEHGSVTVEALKIVEERCRFVAMDLSEIRDLVKAEMKLRVYDGVETSEWKSMEVTDPDVLNELGKIFVNAEAGSEGKCPYRAVLTLTRDDGKEIVLTLAMDSCDGFILGSCGSYYMGQKGKARVWEVFEELRIETGWPEMNECCKLWIKGNIILKVVHK